MQPRELSRHAVAMVLYTHDSLTIPAGEDAGATLVRPSPAPDAPDASDALDAAPLDAAALEAFARDGYVVIKSAVSNAALDRARAWIDAREESWREKPGTRADDWRSHRDQRVDAPLRDGHAPLLALLLEPVLAAAATQLFGGADVAGVSYTQIARRSSVPAKRRGAKPLPSTAYHIDGEANQSGARFPDCFSVLSPRGRSGDGSRRRRGCHVDIPWRRVAATPRLRRLGCDAAAATWIIRGRRVAATRRVRGDERLAGPRCGRPHAAPRARHGEPLRLSGRALARLDVLP